MQDATTTPASTLSSLASLVSMVGGLKDLLKPLTQATSSTSQPAFPIQDGECVWRSDNPDGALIIRSNPPLPLYRIASNGSDAFVVEKATERAALGEPKWCTVDTGLPPEALSFLASKVKNSNDAEDKMREYVHTSSILLRSVLSEDAPLDVIRATIRQAFERYEIPLEGHSLVSSGSGVEVKAAPQQITEDDKESSCPKLVPDDFVVHLQGCDEAQERIRIEWTTQSGGYRKVVLDPNDKRLRFYNDASGPVVFSIPIAHGTEQDVIDLVESFKRLGI